MSKISVFYVDWFNINDTYNLFPKSLNNYPKDINSYNVSNMSYQDVHNIINDAHMLVIDRSIFAAIHYQGYRTVSVNIRNYINSDFYKSIWELLLSQRKIKVLIASGQDLHWVEEEEGFDIYEQLNGIAWFYEKPPTKKSEVMPELMDPWMKERKCPHKAWSEIKKRVKSRFEMTHFLSKVCKSDIKIWDLCVYGVKYAPRKMVINSANKGNLRLITGDRINTISNMIPDASLKTIKIITKQYLQRKITQHSKITFVCGSAYNYPVRKFFETASSGSFLLAKPCLGFEDFGFRSGYNYLEIDLDNIHNQIKDIAKDGKYLSVMAERLQSDIFLKHNLKKRSEEFIEFLKHLYNGKELVSEFNHGEFIHEFY